MLRGRREHPPTKTYSDKRPHTINSFSANQTHSPTTNDGDAAKMRGCQDAPCGTLCDCGACWTCGPRREGAPARNFIAMHTDEVPLEAFSRFAPLGCTSDMPAAVGQ
eukprot:1856528-Pyramimonas_sp.AAC.1